MHDLPVTDLRPFIPASDFALSMDFYASLGWETRLVGEGLALVTLGDQQHFYIQDYYLKDVAENCMLHLTVADAHAWHRHVAEVLQSKRFPGARVQPPEPQAYGAVVTFVHDPAGVLLHLCEWRADASSNA
jgi:catechol 2,3-dioxygenase-like lactoylglutathione lyase family enzyme